MLLVFAKSAGSVWRGKKDEVMKAFEVKRERKKKRIPKED